MSNLIDIELDNGYNKLEFIDLIKILERENSLEVTTIHLFRHFRCASHTINLIVSTNINAYFVNKNQINKNNFFFNLLRNYTKKLWLTYLNYGQNKTNLQLLLNVSMTYLKTSNKTRWNSTIDSLIQIKNFIIFLGTTKFNDTINFCTLNQPNQVDVQLINKYFNTMT